MVVPSLTDSTGAVFTFNEGDVDEISTSIGANLDFDSMPASAATDGLLFDFNGVTKTITVTGKITLATSSRVVPGSITTIDNQRKFLESFLGGSQSGLTFISNYSSTWNGSAYIDSRILIGNITFTESSGLPNQLAFTMQLLVGSV